MLFIVGVVSLSSLAAVNSWFPSSPARASRFPLANMTPVFLPLVLRQVGSLTTVSIRNFAYDPQVITITVGTQVKWTNDDVFPHTVTSGTCSSTFSCTPSGEFDSSPPPSPSMSSGQSYAFTFNSAGSFAYYCRLHFGNMTGTVNVIQ